MPSIHVEIDLFTVVDVYKPSEHDSMLQMRRPMSIGLRLFLNEAAKFASIIPICWVKFDVMHGSHYIFDDTAHFEQVPDV